ncbi:MAG: carbohydrate-binding domain-containing protein [Acidimicrobiales bacterium]
MTPSVPWTRLSALAIAIALTAACTSADTTETSTADAAASESATSDTDVATTDATASSTVEVAADPVVAADVAALPDETITVGDETISITQGGTYTLTGEGTGSVVVETDEDVVLVLDGVNIVSDSGAAISVLSANNVFITLAEGSENVLEDATTRTDTEINGTIYSDADLSISGTGSLTVVANYEDGIVTKDDFVLASGTVVVTAADDGIRGRDSITVSGGSLTVTSGGDGLKTTYADDLEKGWVHITGGSIRVDSGDDAIKAQTSMTIDGGTIEIVDSVEGLEALNITINGGDITLYASDDGINAAVGDIAGDVFINVNGGTIDVTVGSGDTDGFDSNGTLSITDGDITVTAPTSSFDVDGTAEFTGGTVTVNGEQVTTLPQGMGGGGGGGGDRGGRPGG